MPRLGERAEFPFQVHPHMLRHACGFKLANDGQDIAGIFGEPERPNHGIADVVVDELHTEGLVDEQAGQHQEGGAGRVEERAHGVGEDVIEPRPPALRPDVAEDRRQDDALRPALCRPFSCEPCAACVPGRCISLLRLCECLSSLCGASVSRFADYAQAVAE